jgi:hypothetical protein
MSFTKTEINKAVSNWQKHRRSIYVRVLRQNQHKNYLKKMDDKFDRVHEFYSFNFSRIEGCV